MKDDKNSDGKNSIFKRKCEVGMRKGKEANRRKGKKERVISYHVLQLQLTLAGNGIPVLG